jgi:hypothetical protein
MIMKLKAEARAQGGCRASEKKKKQKGRYTWDTKRRLEDNIKMDFEGLEREGLDWMKLTQYRAPVMGCCEQS